MNQIKLYILFTILLTPILTSGQIDRKLVVFDLSSQNKENNSSRIISAIRLCEVAGISYDTTSVLDKALDYPIILFATKIEDLTFNSAEAQQIIDYTALGGVLIISSPRDKELYEVSGIKYAPTSNELNKLTWDIHSDPELFYLIDDPLEKSISLGRETGGPIFATRYFSLSSGTSLASYENDSCAVVYNAFGDGHCYTFGPDFREIIYRNMIDGDINANRTYSNGFEPTSDVICFWIRNIVRKHIPNNVYKHTVPGEATSIAIITHDVDSRSGMNTMLQFSEYESANSIPGSYNITVRYFVDELMSDFYIGSEELIKQVIEDGHTIASHSVGHFIDFADKAIFPFGNLGNTISNYQPYHVGGQTIGGSVLGELEVSKDVLEQDHGVKIRSFRAGHLVYPDSLAIGLQMTGYEFNSTHSANNILTSFPYYIPNRRSFNTDISEVLEIPMTISDVIHADPIDEKNYQEKVDLWLSATIKYHENNSPVVLLIHPNKDYKLLAEKNYIDNLPEGCIPYDFEQYGDFWKKREALKFHSTLANDTLSIYMDNDSWTSSQSFIIEDADLSYVRFFNVHGEAIDFTKKAWSDDQNLYHSQGGVTTSKSNYKDLKTQSSVYPNPTNDIIHMELARDYSMLHLFSVLGDKVTSLPINTQNISLSKTKLGLKNGVYFVLLRSNIGQTETQKIVWQ